MENRFTNIKFESDRKVSSNTITKIITASEDEPALIRNLMKTKNFSNVVIKKQGNMLTVLASGKDRRLCFDLYGSKYNFVGLRCTIPFMNVTSRLDNLFVKVGTDLPAYDLDNDFLSFLKSNLFYKQSLKIRYTRNLWGSGPLLKLDMGKTAKIENKHLSFNISADNLLTIAGRKIDVQIKNRASSNKFSEIDFDTMIKLKYKKNDLDLEYLPIGSKVNLKFIHSVLTTSLYKYKAEVTYRKFFYPRFIPDFSNLEFSFKGLVTNDESNNLSNMRGFFLNVKPSADRHNISGFSSLKFSYLNFKALMDLDVSPFLHLSSRFHHEMGIDWDAGFGLQKIYKNKGIFEVLFNYRKQGIQLRYEPF